MNMTVRAKEYTTAAEMMAGIKEARRRLFGKPKVVNWKPEPKPLPPRGNVPYLKTKDIHEFGAVTVDIDIPAWMQSPIWFYDHCYMHSVHAYIQKRAGDFGFTAKEVTGPSRKVDLTFARHIILWEIKKVVKPSMSYPHLGQIFGGRDHCSIHHAVKKIQAMKDRGEI